MPIKTISLPDEVLQAIDNRAKELNKERSEYLRDCAKQEMKPNKIKDKIDTILILLGFTIVIVLLLLLV